MKKTVKVGLMVGAATIAMVSNAMAQSVEDRLTALEDRATADRTRLSTLEQQYNYASWTFDNGRPVLSTGDGRFTMGFRIRFQTDFAGFSQDATHPPGFSGPTDLSSGVAMRRAYFGVEGKVYNDFAYEIRLNAGGSDGGSFGVSGVPNAGEGDPLLNKAVVTYTGIPNWHFNIGVLEPSFMMEGTTSSANLTWIERPEIENIAADSFGAGDSRRGIEIGWNKIDSLWSGDNLAFDIAWTGGKTGSAQNHGSNSGATVGAGDENDQVLGRFVDRVWSDGISNVQFGASVAQALYTGSNSNPDGGVQQIRFRDRPEVRVDGTRLIDTGGINAKTGNMWAVDFEGNLQNLYFEAEYASFTADRQCGSLTAAGNNNPLCITSSSVIDHPNFHGWVIGASWIITGETKTYTPNAIAETQAGFGAPVPSAPFSLAGDSWGTWELAVRYSDTDLNWHTSQTAVTNTTNTSQLAGILGGEERIVDLGLNWYFNRNVRLMLDDLIVSVTKGTTAAPASQDINVVALRLQFAN